MTANAERVPAPVAKPPLFGHLTGWARKWLARWLSPKGPDYLTGGSYRFLARHIDIDLPCADGGKTILVSCPSSWAASNDAILMIAYFLREELGCQVLLIDGTFFSEGVGSVLGLSEERGLGDVAYGPDQSIGDVIRPTRNDGIFIVPPGRLQGRGMPPLQSDKIEGILRSATSRFNYVLLQQGAIFQDSRYLDFTGKADLILMLVEEGGTLLNEVERSMSVFRDHQISDVRIVLTTPN